MTSTETARVADKIDDILRTAVLLGASDDLAISAAIAQLELLFRARLTKSYLRQARRTYTDSLLLLRGELGWPSRRREGARA